MKHGIKFVILALFLGPLSSIAHANEDSLKRQKSLTEIKTLKNGVVFVQRQIPGSEIAHFEINFLAGQADLPEGSRALNSLVFDLVTLASKKYSKEQIFSTSEKFSIGIQCSGGIEHSSCQFETVIENFDKGFDILSSVIRDPLFSNEDLEVMRERRIAQYQQDEQNPESYVNTLVNTIFYPTGHPYRHLSQDAIPQVRLFKQIDVINYYAKILGATPVQVVYVGPLLTTKQVKSVETFLLKFNAVQIRPRNITAPSYIPSANVAFEHRPIPTAYIRAKFNAPGATSSDAATSKVLFEIISEELHEEVRTKRSLSYAIFGTTLQLEQGIGIVHASTSKPRETVEVIAQVLKKIRDTTYTPEKIAEFKNVFTTSYFLTLETHDSFAAALASAQMQFNDANKLYELPAKISAVTGADVQRVAREILKNFRVAVVYDKEKFIPEWVNPLKTL